MKEHEDLFGDFRVEVRSLGLDCSVMEGQLLEVPVMGELGLTSADMMRDFEVEVQW